MINESFKKRVDNSDTIYCCWKTKLNQLMAGPGLRLQCSVWTNSLVQILIISDFFLI